VPVAARRIGQSGRTVVEGVVIDVSIPGIEAVIAGIGAAIAPVRIVPGRPDMPAHTGAKVCGIRRDARAGESNRCNGGGKYQSSRNTHRDGPTHNVERAVSPQMTGLWQIKTAGLVKQARWILLNNLAARLRQIDMPSPSSTAYCTVSVTRCQPVPLKPATILMRTICTSLSCIAVVSTVVSRIYATAATPQAR
jgi:hypothetical protein